MHEIRLDGKIGFWKNLINFVSKEVLKTVAKRLTTDLINGYSFLLVKDYFGNGGSQSCLVSKPFHISVTTVKLIRALNVLMLENQQVYPH